MIIDGGKGQLSAALEALDELNAIGKTTLIGLAKNEEEIFFPGDQESLKLPYNSDSLKLIRRIRDEVHRFGISFHRNKRSKGTFKNELGGYSGYWQGNRRYFIKRIQICKKYSGDQIRKNCRKLIGNSKAKLISCLFQKNE